MTRLFASVGFRFIEVVRLCSPVQLRLSLQPSYLSPNSLSALPSFSCDIYFFQKRNYASNPNDRFNPPKQLATLDAFTQTEEKNKDSYLDLLHFYKAKEKHRRGHVEFIYAALKYMKEFGVNKDLEAYKALIDVMPKGKFVAQNLLQSEFQHYPKQQQCIIDVLEEMEINGVIPDEEMEDMVLNLFGRRSHAIRRLWRMLYWMPKLRNLSPWAVPEPLPDSSLELAKLAIERITSVDPATKISVYEMKDVKETVDDTWIVSGVSSLQQEVEWRHGETKDVKDAVDDTWIVSGVSPLQQELLERHDATRPLYIEGSFRVWLRAASVAYFILRADPAPPRAEQDIDDVSHLTLPLFSEPSEREVAKQEIVHEQEEGTIMAVCATGSSSRDSLLSWVRLLQRDIPRLGEIPILFTLKSPVGPTEPLKEIEGDEPLPMTTDVDRSVRTESAVKSVRTETADKSVRTESKESADK